MISCAKRPAPSAVGPPPPQPPVTSVKLKPQPKIILSTRNEPIGLNVADFLPVSVNADERRRPGSSQEVHIHT